MGQEPAAARGVASTKLLNGGDDGTRCFALAFGSSHSHHHPVVAVLPLIEKALFSGLFSVPARGATKDVESDIAVRH
jgi:hypothetical protein